jgi:ADP-ribose diphosphatase
MKARLIDEHIAYEGFFQLRRLTVERDSYEGTATATVVQEVLHRSDVVAALLLDTIADKVVMVEQFRGGALAAGLPPWITDIVAGRIEPGQSPSDAIRREILEESGLAASSLTPIGSYLTAPHLSSERVHLFCAHVDASQAAGTHGVRAESEDIRPLVMTRVEALDLLQRPSTSLWAGLALHWLAGQDGPQRGADRRPD